MCPEKPLQWKALEIMRERTKHHLFVWVGAWICMDNYRLLFVSFYFLFFVPQGFPDCKVGPCQPRFCFLKCFESGQAGRWHFEQNPAVVLHLHSRSLRNIQFLWRECMPFKKRDLSARWFKTASKDDVPPKLQATRALETRTFIIAIL